MPFLNLKEYFQRNHTELGQSRVAISESQYTFKSVFPLSDDRDNITETNGGTVTQVNGGEYRVRATSTAGSIAQLETAQAGDYIPGAIFEPSIGIRIPKQPTGNGKIQFGYFEHDGNEILNGSFLEYNANGVFHKVVSGSSERFNNPISIFDMAYGNIFNFPFLYYGYGFAAVEASFSTYQTFARQRPSIYYPDGEILFQNSNMPLTCRVESDGEQLDAFIAGREMAPLGQNDRNFRIVNQRRTVTGIDTSYAPIVSVKVKENFRQIFTQILSLTVTPDAKMEVAIFKNTSLTGANFTVADDYNVNEIATEWDTSSTSMTGGDKKFGDTFAGGSGSNEKATGSDLFDTPVLVGDIYTIAAQRFTGTNGSIDLNLKVR